MCKMLGFDEKPRVEVGCFGEDPRQILVAILGVTFTRLLAIAPALAVETVRVRCEILRAPEALDESNLKQNDAGEDRPDAEHSSERRVLCARLRPFCKRLLRSR
jgi:hypothetical protein